MHMEPKRIEWVESWDDPNLAGSRLKLARASELLMAMQWESAQFRLDGQLVKVDHREESDDLGNKWAVGYCKAVAAVPLRLSLLAGDLVHNLRSALDHAVYQLVLRDKGNQRTKHSGQCPTKSQSTTPCRATTPNSKASRTKMPGI
jgi:hypothetical protein